MLAEISEGVAKRLRQQHARREQPRARAIAGIQKQLGVQPINRKPDPSGVFKLAKWEPQVDAGEPKMADAADQAGVKALEINLDKPSRVVASWRSRVLLDADEYRFEGKVATKGVVPLKEPTGEGAGLRISGSSRPTSSAVTRLEESHLRVRRAHGLHRDRPRLRTARRKAARGSTSAPQLVRQN